MLAQNRIAFKEWGAGCAALGQGRQTVIVRKGGIHEGEQGFRVDHREFWLFPTRFHQGAEQLQPESSDLLQAPIAIEPASGKIMLALYAVVDKVLEIKEPSVLPLLNAIQVLNQETIQQRFEYKKTGLFVLLVRAYQLPQPFEMENETHYGGCRSWVELTQEYSTSSLTPILTAEQFEQQQQALGEIIA
ncbi:DUF1802 family protein [uncultured Gimesia sp.]|uniref:DUF1802 family protein n=1 Tax=uncultured Gimesia sp. TaxID=1678688 RepID=UPI0030D953BC|tara:strand:- start:74969 stop:75535 length:567 start_codon:yes stop_codon:yes gene_type:complete